MKLETAAVFSDHMVLQREKRIAVFGTGEDGRRVEARLGGASASCTVRDGRFLALLPPLPAGGPYELTVADGETELLFSDVLIGEVWLAGGQSNMELELQNCRNGAEELANSRNERIRFYNVPKAAFPSGELDRAEAASRWKVCGPDAAADCSAVAYFFARRLQAELDVPVGVVDCYWGGTSVSCWMSRERLSRTAAGQKYLDDYDARIGGKTDEQYDGEMRAYNGEYNAWCARVEARRRRDPDVTWEVLNAECGLCPWPQPAGRKSPFRPCGLYGTMLRRVQPYALRGFLYYQGEEDWNRCGDYREMMCCLIDQWRADWGDDELPFAFVQLPMYAAKADFDAGRDDKRWCVLREAQWRVSRTVRNTALAVILDCGEFDNVHPLDKQTVGLRLALQALNRFYGVPIAADGPSFRSAAEENGRLRVFFDHAESGLVCLPETLAGFEVAGEDGAYFPADAEIDGETVLVSSAKVPRPKFVRYAWTNWGPAPLYNGSGFPAAPFRMRDGTWS